MAELLADKNFYSIQVCVFNGKDKLSYSKRNNFGQQSILQAYEDVKHYCEALNDTHIDDSSLPRKTKKMFDNEAFEEAWVNALVHNDWIHGNPPSIYWYEDRMEIMSYGGLKEGLSKEDFFEGVSDPVNKELMDVFVQCDIVDRSGHGVPKVVKAYGREAFRFLGVGIMVTIPFDKKGFNATVNFTENFTENESKVIKLIQKNNKITTSKIASEITLSRRAVQTIVNSLKSKGILIRVGPDKGGHWEMVDKKED